MSVCFFVFKLSLKYNTCRKVYILSVQLIESSQTEHTSITSTLIKKQNVGLLWWMSSKESTFQCRGCGFDSWLGAKIPRAAVQLSLRATTTEPVRLN